MKTRAIWITIGFVLLFLAIDLIGIMGDITENILSIKVYMGVYCVYITIELNAMRKEYADRILEYVRNPLIGIGTLSAITHLNEQSFYSQLEYIISNEAITRVWISYMHDQRPSNLIGTKQYQYYSNFKKLVKKHQDVTFKRLILASVDALEWIAEIATELEGQQNFNLAVYVDGGDSRASRPLSIQCIDDKYTFLVAVHEEEQTSGRRDILVKDVEFTGKFSKRYSELYDCSVSIVEAGKFDRERFEKLKKEVT